MEDGINLKFETKRINYFGGMLQVELPLHLLSEAGDLQKQANGGKALSVEVKVKRKSRSLNANAYCWVLCHSISERLKNHTDEDIYKRAIRIAGVRSVMSMTEQAYEKFNTIWSSRGLGWFADKLDEAKAADGCCTVIAYYGSSQYDTKEMATLIDWLVDEAEGLGCDVLSESDRTLLLEDWGK